jgi:hypothetical protein
MLVASLLQRHVWALLACITGTRCPHVRLTSSLRDSHCYFFARWVLDLLVANPSMSSIQVGAMVSFPSASLQAWC